MKSSRTRGQTEETGIVTDNLSTLSSNSRNFQMPEKDFIKQISLTKEQQYSDQLLTVKFDDSNLINL